MNQRQNSLPYIRQIDFMFYHEAEIRQAVLEAREERETPDIRNGSGLPDPTASEAIKNLTPVYSVFIGGHEVEVDGNIRIVDALEVKYPERWLTVIDKTYAWCRRQSNVHYEIARRRYSGEYYVQIHQSLSISEPLFYQLLDKIRIYAALQAAQLNLIYVE